VTGNHQAGQPAAANMSLGGGFSQALNDAVHRSVDDGVVYAVAAGNGFFGIGYDPCLGATNGVGPDSPASEPSAITVGATDSTDAEASWSNRGPCVDMFAPGVSITSAWWTSDNATNKISGTSMATPHVAGTAALYLQVHPNATAAEVDQGLTANASVGKITLTQSQYKTAPEGNYLLYSAFIAAGPPPPPAPPNAPSSASAKPASSTSVTVTWTDNSGNETAFRVERSEDGGTTWGTATTTGANVTSYTDGGRASEAQVCYRVIASNDVGDSGPSNTSCTTPPAAPSNLSAAKGAPSYSQIKLTWTVNSAVADNQEILRCTGSSCTPSTAIATVSAGATSYDDNTVAANTTYSYRVRAKKDGGVSDPSGTASATTDPNPNQAPNPRYTWSCGGKQGRVCNFNGSSSSDPDGSITAWTWNFGDGSSGSGSSVQHTFATRSTFNVQLTVKDNGNPGLTNSRTCAVQTGTSGTCQ
jgi:hypothetical protein